MNSIGILLSHPIPIAEIKEIVAQLNGEWHDEDPSLEQASFTSNGAWVFLRGALTQCDDVQFVSGKDLADANERIGEVRAVLTIDFSKTDESRKTADAIVSAMLDKWRGVLISDD